MSHSENNQEVIKGKLDPFFETGTEGILWSVVDDRYPNDYTGLKVLKDGDHLRVFNGDTIRWEGTIKLEYERRYRPYPLNPQYGQQEVNGLWVHGFQADLEPEVWARMFFDQCRAELVQAEGKPTRPKRGVASEPDESSS